MSRGNGSSSPASASPAATRAVHFAGRQVHALRSTVLTETMSLEGLPTGAFGPTQGGTLSLTIALKMQLKPSLLADIKLDMAFSGRSLLIHQILTSNAMYLDAPAIDPPTGGKPWTKISLSGLSGGVSQGTLFTQLEEGDPMAATSSPQGLASLLAAARKVSVTGSGVTDGVPTTEYTGTISFRAFLAALPASERQSLASAPASLQTSGLPFKIWIDRSHQVRKLDLQLLYSGVLMAIVVNVRSVNTAVHVSAPPASQVSG